jgi:predicted lipoprotein with Yx(FWY)xxD motif
MPVTRLNTRSKFAVIGLCAAIGLAACGDDETADTSSVADTTRDDSYDYPAVVDSAETTAPADAVAAAADVLLADSDLGQILVDGAGNTLYLFTPDPADTVTCTGGCASAWPGLAADDSLTVGDGLDASLFSTATGVDGGPQVSFNGHPLYHFSGDSAPGDTNGQGSGGVWFVIGADGNAITG